MCITMKINCVSLVLEICIYAIKKKREEEGEMYKKCIKWVDYIIIPTQILIFLYLKMRIQFVYSNQE